MAKRKTPGSASTQDASQKPASGNKPKSANTTGLVLPETSPNRPGANTNPPVKAETPQEKSLLEKAGDLLEKGEIGFLNQAKDAVNSGIDAAVGAAGGGMLAQGAGAIAKGANEILFPTNVIDIIPGGKILSGGKKAAKLGEQVLEQAGKGAAKKGVEKGTKEAAEGAAEKGVKDAKTKDGAISDGKKKERKKDPCEHPNDAKKKKYVVYKATEYDKHGNPIGTYIGRTSGAAGDSMEAILDKRLKGHHRNAKELEEIFSTDRYAAVRGAEQLEIEKLRQSGEGVDQINGVGERNKQKDDYRDCAKSKGAG